MNALPADFQRRINNQFADEAADFLSAIERAPATSVRLNPWKPGDYGLKLGRAIEWCRDAYFLDERPNFTLNPLFHAGRFYPQEASSMYLWHVLDVVRNRLPDEPIVLDLCAAPGGKSTLISSFFGENAVLVSNEIVRQRAWILRENIIKWGAPNCLITNLESKNFAANGAQFDLVVVDAPCSGEGMFRKNAEAIAQWTPENASMCARRQREIVQNAWETLVEGGVMIYSTCTFNPAENEENMQWIADNFDVEFLKIPVDNASGAEVVTFCGGEGYAFYPHRSEGEGFFICAMTKLDGRRRNLPKKLPKLTRSKSALDYLANPSEFAAYVVDGNVVALPRRHEEVMLKLHSLYKNIHLGVPIGKDARDIIVAEELPMSQAFNVEKFASVEVDERAALEYLSGSWSKDVQTSQGINIVRYRGATLGYVKCIGARANNYYPKEWRIRMNIDAKK